MISVGEIWGNCDQQYLIIGYEECGCSFLRAVDLHDCAMLPHRDSSLVKFLFGQNLEKFGNIEHYVSALLAEPETEAAVKKKKRPKKPQKK